MTAIINLLKALSDYIGSPLWITETIILLLTILAIAWVIDFLMKFIRKLNIRRFNKILKSNLSHYYSNEDISRATKYFIPLYYQESAPSIHEELGGGGIPIPKQKIIPAFIKDFSNQRSYNKFILVLADTGMGKTTFLINLFLKYLKKKNNTSFRQKFPIKLYPIGDSETFKDIDRLPNKENTILLLDALDEDIQALKDYNSRLQEIIKKVKKFKRVIITYRTQFFPSEVEIPSKAGIFSWGGSGEYEFQKYYLSVFDQKDINKYLFKKYGFFRRSTKIRAQQIIKKVEALLLDQCY